ncbi:glycosyltransferase family 4 protein [Candidatus Nomurabacteria bacterium]|nr:glycosyltransferase family 4 protein [Candidatus Nomurabacteria bacterium]
MKIAYLANVRFPSERAHAAQIGHMCQAFSNNQVEVDLVVGKRVVATKEDMDKQLGFNSKFNVIRMQSCFFSTKIKSVFYLSEFIFAVNFYFRLSKNKYEIVYSRSEWILFFLSYLLPSEKLIWESHEAKLSLPARRLLSLGIKTVVISDGIFETYAKFGVPEAQLKVGYDGIDESFFDKVDTKFEARERLSIDQSKKVVMYIGGLDEWKGIRTFCEASEIGEGKTFVVIGGSDEQISGLLDEYPKVTFLGQLPYPDLRNNQQAADVLVVPNTAKNDLSSKYTSPLKLFAHMASGVPLVASDIPSITTVTGSNLVTLFVPDNATSLSECISLVLTNNKESIEKSEKLKEISKKYTWTKRAESIISFVKA